MIWIAPEWRISALISQYLHHGWRKFWMSTVWNQGWWVFWISTVWNALKGRVSECITSQNIFTMVEENFGFWWCEIHQIEGFWRLSQSIFTMVKENFAFWWCEIHQPEWRILALISEYLHHGWRKLWILMMWNAPEWRISALISEYLHLGWRKFWILMTFPRVSSLRKFWLSTLIKRKKPLKRALISIIVYEALW